MAELSAFIATDLALNDGLFPLDGPAVLTRSATMIQMTALLGRGQTIGGTFTYAPDGELIAGTIQAIAETVGTPRFEMTGLALDVFDYSEAIADGDVFATRALIFAGDDTITGSPAPDRLLGFDGDDLIDGGFDADEMNGNQGADTVLGGHGNDTIHGGQGADHVDGQDSDDLAAGSKGADQVRGGLGADRVHGGQGNDTVDGGAGADTVLGDLGDDALLGREGADVFLFEAGSGRDVIEDFDPIGQGDRIALPAKVNGTTIDDSADMMGRAGISPDGVMVNLGGGNVILLRHYSTTELEASHFLIL